MQQEWKALEQESLDLEVIILLSPQGEVLPNIPLLSLIRQWEKLLNGWVKKQEVMAKNKLKPGPGGMAVLWTKRISGFFQVWIEFGRIKLPQGYHPNDVEEEWGKLIIEMLEREKSLRPAVER